MTGHGRRRRWQVGVGTLSLAALTLGLIVLAPTANATPDPGSFTLSTSSLTFGSVGIGLTSATQKVFVTNVTAGPVDPQLAYNLGGLPFSLVNNCTGLIAAGTSCTVDVTFSPVAAGFVEGDAGLTLAGSSYALSVNGTGIPAFLVTSSLAFGNVGLGTTSGSQLLTVTNNTPGPLDLEYAEGLDAGSPWTLANQCGTSPLAGYTYCFISVTFSPTTSGVADVDPGLSLRGRLYPVALSGTGVPALVLSPSSVDFGSVKVGQSSGPHTVLVGNNTNLPLDLASLTAGFSSGSPFSLMAGPSAGCGPFPYVLAAFAYCTLDITFTPTAPGPATSDPGITLLGVSYPLPVSGTGTQDPPPNTLPTISAALAAVTVNEGPNAANNGTFNDLDGDTVTVSANVGTVTQTGSSSGTWSWTGQAGDGPASQAVTITANDGHGGVASATFPLTVVNVAPTVSPIVVASVVTPSGLQTTLTAAATDPSAADAAAGFVWQWKVDGAVEPGTGNVLGKTFSGCAPHIVSATATDKDGGVSLPRSTTVSGNYQAHFQEPLNEGVNNAVQKGRVVPVKVTVTCNGVAMTGLSPAIQLLTGDQTTGVESVTDYVDTTSASGADTTGVMRASGSSYIYNLQVPSTAAAGALFTIRVRPLAGGNDLRVVLTIRK